MNEQTQELLVFLNGDSTAYKLPIDGRINTPRQLDIIQEANRVFLIRVHQEGRHGIDGCLPLKCIWDSNKEEGGKAASTNINPRYLLNCFIDTLQHLNHEDDNRDLFVRDGDITIPATREKMLDLMTKYSFSDNMYNANLLNVTKTTSRDVNWEDDNDLIDLSYFMSMVLKQAQLLGQRMHNKWQKMQQDPKFKRAIALSGGITQNSIPSNKDDSFFSLVNEELEAATRNCTTHVHSEIKRNRELMLNTLVRLQSVIGKITSTMDVPIYYNTALTFGDMFAVLGEIFDMLFMYILPKQSMGSTLSGIMYYATVMDELGMRGLVEDHLMYPILLRLAFCCLKNEDNPECVVDETYLSQNHTKIFKDICKVNKNAITPGVKYEMNNVEENLNFIMSVADKCDLQDAKLIDTLYHVLEYRRHRTYEFYLIMFLRAMNIKGINANKRDRLLNVKNIFTPLHEIMTCFYLYVNRQDVYTAIFQGNVVHCQAMLEGFNKLYAKELKGALQKFLKATTTLINN